ncbi:MAG TPA: DUF4296 domain-containing protein [Xanthomarina sp.]|nr:DUF4296 domain-containing protein [Xanthomarina sp.]
MKKIIWALTLFTLISSCSNSNKPKKPKDLIPKDKMVNILLDVSLINSAKGLNKSIMENNGLVPDMYIYTKHQIDSLQFKSSNRYYAYNLEEYDDIIKKVNDSLKTLRNKYNSLVEKEKAEERKKDSIEKAKRPRKTLLEAPSWDNTSLNKNPNAPLKKE